MAERTPDKRIGSRPLAELFPRVLIVDDDRLTCAVMRDMVAALGIAVDTAATVAEARKRLAAGAYDLALVDLYLPDGTGMALVDSALRVPCIVIASRGEVESGVRAIEAGAVDFLLKPVDAHELRIRLALVGERLKLREFERGAKAELETAVRDRTRNLEEALRRVEQLYRETTDLLASALEARDAETHHHSMRVATYSVRLAEGMGISGESLRQIEWGALLHDVGKIAVPDHILRKSGPLTDEERAIMIQHPDVGYRMVRKVGFLNEAAELVLAHQERVDGSGYPRGLRGDTIPLSARIFAVADTLDAITSDRPYRVSRSFSTAREVMHTEAGRTLDAGVVRVYTAIRDEDWVILRTHAERIARQTGITGDFLRL